MTKNINNNNNEIPEAMDWLAKNGFGCSKAQMAALTKTQKQAATGVADYKTTARHSFKGMVHPKA